MRSWLIMMLVMLPTCRARADGLVDYARQVKPILQARCYACHGVLKQKNGLRVDTAALAIKGGKSGVSIVPGDPAASPLFERVAADEESERMPPEGDPLKPAEIDTIRTWINQGAKAPADEPTERDPRDHWAFKTPIRPPVPRLQDQAWTKNPIDAFIGSAYQQHGLTPQRPADKRLWLRRVSLDLLGLPPTREEMNAFIADSTPEAYDKVADRLLASPGYGERWGRRWMDIWRYSDWWGLGAEVRNSQKHIWHWRDWIIESLNSDKGYDQMLREMLAADELYPNDLDKLRASGFLARQYFKFNRTTWLDETIEHTAKSMLGLTFNCAKCHDHKYDPFLQTEYYQMRAIFEPYQVRTDALPGEVDFEKDGLPRAFDCNLDAKTYFQIRGDDRTPDKTRVISPAFPAFLSLGPVKIVPVSLPAEAVHPELRPFVLETHVKKAEQAVIAARQALGEAKKQHAQAEAQAKFGPPNLDRTRLSLLIAEKALAAAEAQPPLLKARAAADRARFQTTPAANVPTLVAAAVRSERLAAIAAADETLARADLEVTFSTPAKKAETEKKRTAAQTALDSARKALDKPGDSYNSLAGSLKTLESNLETEDSRRKPFPATSTGRRTALANWITDPRHPLPARVAVNHIWSRHFGKPLVPTVFDFGRKGTPPTHPELLDWLAVELVEHNWSMKHIHRLIVTSQTYRLSSSSAGAASQTLASDSENRFHWRATPIRLESDAIRDSLLSLAGELDPTRGGPPIPVANESSSRRSLYFFHSHNEHQKFLSMFDDASVLECYRRAESIVPQQALTLENSPFATTMAEKIARRISSAHPGSDTRAFIREAFLTILATEPSDLEFSTTETALTRLTDAASQQKRANPELHARINLVHALINHNDFITVR